MTDNQLEQLLQTYLEGNASPEQVAMIDQWYNIKENMEQVSVADKESIKQQLFEKIQSALAIESALTLVPFYKRRFFRLSAAAAVIAAIIGSYLMFFSRTNKQQEIVKVPEQSKDVKAPETNRAMITLADGRTVYLDSATNGQLAVQGNIKLVKLANGQIAYQTASGEIIKELQYNTLNNPRGSKIINMTLADGSRVWLNTGSSVTFPVAFIGNERKISITGEAYLEVAHNPLLPFIVRKGETSVQVLGTKFNVNAYDDEDDIRVTLLEGSVKISNDQSSLTIKPNQQAVVSGNQMLLNKNVNVEEVMAWKNGLFQFEGANIESIMRQISRWYDVEVVYEMNAKGLHFSGDISREVEASKVFKMLQATEALHFRIEGRKVFVEK